MPIYLYISIKKIYFLQIVFIFKIGDIAPLFSLPDKNNKAIFLSNYKGKWIVLYLYPKDNTPGCTTETCDFSINISDFQNLNAINYWN